LLHNIDISVVSECLCHLRAQYPIKSPDICIGQQILYKLLWCTHQKQTETSTTKTIYNQCFLQS